PDNLYIYGDRSNNAQMIQQAIYEPLMTTFGYSYQPLALAELPDLTAGTARMQPIMVRSGDRVVDASGDPVTLQAGVQIDTALGESITYDGESPVEMVQMSASFAFNALTWSDGTPLTAVDSVYSFNVAADSVTPVDKSVIERTASYEAIDDNTAVWTGLPGYIDRTYFLNVWVPLPSHTLTRFTANQLLEAAETNQPPVGYGPFVVHEWKSTQLTLIRNTHYAQPNMPHVDQLVFIEEANGLDGVRNGRCQIALYETNSLNQTPDILTAQTAGDLTAIFRQSLVFEHIDFGINPVPNYQRNHPDWFEDIRVRRAIMHCIDRQQMIENLQFGQGVLHDAYVASNHPAFPEDATTYTYDPDLANQLLDETGLIDQDGDGLRERRAFGEELIITPISITLGTDDVTPLRRQINEQVQANLQQCGIGVALYESPVQDWYADGPFSPLFGRRFDLGTFAWLSRIEPPCNLYLSSNITGPEEEGFGGWNNVNATGWLNEAFDTACETAQSEFIETAEYTTNHQEAIRIFTQELPMMPLFSRVEIILHDPTVTGLTVDVTQRLPLWNAAQLDWDEGE
ncbi:MAG: ABC transporter substrate-binding protein, partial [Chloroflexota bacterium]